MNYSLQEYANDVVYTIQQVCEEEEVPEPNIVSESGRAVTPTTRVLTNVLAWRNGSSKATRPRTTSGRERHEGDASIYENVNAKNLREHYHDALQQREELFTLFNSASSRSRTGPRASASSGRSAQRFIGASSR